MLIEPGTKFGPIPPFSLEQFFSLPTTSCRWEALGKRDCTGMHLFHELAGEILKGRPRREC